jgi:hypothetical protein
MAVVGPTTNHKDIVRWAESQNAHPAEVVPYKFDGEPAVLRFLFGDKFEPEPDLKVISWEQFFALFDTMGLTFVYETEADEGPTGHYQLLQIEEKSPYRFEGKPVA